MGYPTTIDAGGVTPRVLTRDYAGLGNNSATANQAYFVLMPPITAPCTLTGIRTRCNPGGNGHYDVGIYTDNNGTPGTLLANAASSITSLVTVNTNPTTASLIGGNLPLSPGNYWLAYWIDNITDKPYSNSLVASEYPVVTGANGANVLPSSAGSLTLSDSSYIPMIIGILLNGWS